MTCFVSPSWSGDTKRTTNGAMTVRVPVYISNNQFHYSKGKFNHGGVCGREKPVDLSSKLLRMNGQFTIEISIDCVIGGVLMQNDIADLDRNAPL